MREGQGRELGYSSPLGNKECPFQQCQWKPSGEHGLPPHAVTRWPFPSSPGWGQRRTNEESGHSLTPRDEATPALLSVVGRTPTLISSKKALLLLLVTVVSAEGSCIMVLAERSQNSTHTQQNKKNVSYLISVKAERELDLPPLPGSNKVAPLSSSAAAVSENASYERFT